MGPKGFVNYRKSLLYRNHNKGTKKLTKYVCGLSYYYTDGNFVYKNDRITCIQILLALQIK